MLSSRWLSPFLLLASCALLPLTAAGCGASDDPDTAPVTEGGGGSPGAETGEGDEVVNIAHTDVKNQSIGNCWTYASIGWVESLHLQATGQALNLSESYLTYWDWYEKLTKQPGSEKLSTGGWFQTATKVFDKYGLLDEGAFIESEATMDRSARQSQAEAAINASMASGALKKSRSPETVRAELDKAWGLSPAVVKGLADTFGTGAPRTLTATTKLPAGFPLRRSSELKVVNKRAGKAATEGVLKDVSPRWTEVPVPTSPAAQRGFFRRVQKAMHDGHPLLITWDVHWASRNASAGTFPAMKADAKIDGRHMTLLEDYQAASVPNFGLLPAGVTVTDTKTLNAALADQTAIQFFRIKNSWGQGAAPGGDAQFKGYADLYMDYLLPKNGAPKGLVSIILPSDYDDKLPTGIEPDRCAGQPDGDTCAAPLSKSESDRRVLTCTGGKTSAVKLCDGKCAGKGAAITCESAPPPNPCDDVGDLIVPGLYCGDSLAMAPSDVGYSNLYSCQIDPVTKKWVSPATVCPKGCSPQKPGVADRCK